MNAMDAKRPFGRVAVVLAAMMSLACGWMAAAVPQPGREQGDESAIVIDWDLAAVLVDLGVLEIDAYSDDGGAVATMASATSTGPTVIVQGPGGGVIQPAQKFPTLPTGYFPTRPNWDQPWKFLTCRSTGVGDVQRYCVYTKSWTVYVDVACWLGGPTVRHFYTFTFECEVQTDNCVCDGPTAQQCSVPVKGWQDCLPGPAGGPPASNCMPGITISHRVQGNCP